MHLLEVCPIIPDSRGEGLDGSEKVGLCVRFMASPI